MELGLKGKVALVTGASRGIGRGIALAFADEGCDVMLDGARRQGARRGRRRDPRQGPQGRGIGSSTCASRTHRPHWSTTVQQEFGGLDILINNAGTTKRGDFFELTDADWADGYALKFFAHVRLARAAWPLLKARQGCARRDRRNERPQAGEALHHRQFGQCRGRGVHQMPRRPRQGGRRAGQCIHPSLVETERQWRRIRAEVERTGDPEDKVREALCRETGITRFGTVEDVADLVTFMVSARATWLHGATIDLDGGEIPVL